MAPSNFAAAGSSGDTRRAAASSGAAQITALASIEPPAAKASRHPSAVGDIPITSAPLRIDPPSRAAIVSGSVAIPFLKLWNRSEEHTSELSHLVISYAVFC